MTGFHEQVRMDFYRFVFLALGLFQSLAIATELRCRSDGAALGGPVVEFTLRTQDDGRAIASVRENQHTPWVERSASTTRKQLKCSFAGKDSFAFQCQGVDPLEGRLVRTTVRNPESIVDRSVLETTTELQIDGMYGHQNFTFRLSPPQQGVFSSHCEKIN